MTDQEINIAIAEACGWKCIEDELFPGEYVWHKGGASESQSDLPYYCHDLNAMQSAVLAQPEDFRRRFSTALSYLSSETGKLFCELLSGDWARTFLRTKGLWHD